MLSDVLFKNGIKAFLHTFRITVYKVDEIISGIFEAAVHLKIDEANLKLFYCVIILMLRAE